MIKSYRVVSSCESRRPWLPCLVCFIMLSKLACPYSCKRLNPPLRTPHQQCIDTMWRPSGCRNEHCRGRETDRSRDPAWSVRSSRSIRLDEILDWCQLMLERRVGGRIVVVVTWRDYAICTRLGR